MLEANEYRKKLRSHSSKVGNKESAVKLEWVLLDETEVDYDEFDEPIQ